VFLLSPTTSWASDDHENEDSEREEQRRQQQGGPSQVRLELLLLLFHYLLTTPKQQKYEKQRGGTHLLVLPIFDTARRYPPPCCVVIPVFTTMRRYPPPRVIFDVTRRVGAFSFFPLSTRYLPIFDTARRSHPRHSEEVPTSLLCRYSCFHHNKEVPTSSCHFRRDEEGGCLLVLPTFDALSSHFRHSKEVPPLTQQGGTHLLMLFST
jgi:hypothetical protein